MTSFVAGSLIAGRTKPNTDKYSMSLEDDKVRVGATSMQGWRHTMEDAHCIALNVLGGQKDGKDIAIFAVFDGHCGSKIAHTASARVINWVTSTDEFKKERYAEGLKKSFTRGDRQLKDEFPKEKSGSVANVLLMVEGKLFCANTGDSRAVLSRGGVAYPLSQDHKPTQQRETERINKAGGFVGQGRVYGVLAVSRSFGDFQFKGNPSLPDEKQAITAEPDLTEVVLSDSDEFFLSACDGIWDVLSCQEVVDFVREELDNHGDVLIAAEHLLDRCLATNVSDLGTDNMSVIIVQLKSGYLRQFGKDRSPNDISPVVTPSLPSLSPSTSFRRGKKEEGEGAGSSRSSSRDSAKSAPQSLQLL